jgi:transposase-like protein
MSFTSVRRAIYTTDTIESLNMTLRKITKNRSLFPSDEAVFKLLYSSKRLRSLTRPAQCLGVGSRHGL